MLDPPRRTIAQTITSPFRQGVVVTAIADRHLLPRILRHSIDTGTRSGLRGGNARRVCGLGVAFVDS